MATNLYGPATHVLDTSAVLAVFLNEEGGEAVVSAGPEGLISTVNWSEVIAKMSDRGSPPALTLARLERLGCTSRRSGRRKRDEPASFGRRPRIGTSRSPIALAWRWVWRPACRS